MVQPEITETSGYVWGGEKSAMNPQNHTLVDATYSQLARLFRELCVGLVVTGAAVSMAAQEPAMRADPQIAGALRQVSAERIRSNIEKLVSFQTRLTLSAQDPAAIAAGRGIGAAREWIKSEFERYGQDCGGCLVVKSDSFTENPTARIPQPTIITNVYAVLKGTDAASSKRIVLVTGHYASGVAVSLECARVLSKLKFPGTIIFLTVAGEEQGLNGSAHFAKMAKGEDWNIAAALNNDIVGGNLGPGQDSSVVRVFSEGVPVAATDAELRLLRNLGGESDSTSRQVARYIAEVGRTYDAGVKPLLIFRLDRYLRGGDHYSFNKEGFAAVRFTEYREDFNHEHQNIRRENGVEYGDLPKFVNFDYVARVARLNAATLACLAAAPGSPTQVRLRTKELENDTTLSWEGSPLAAGYEVLWRATTSPEWEHVQDVGNVTQATLQQSKDNVIFAVRAVDRQGHRSLPVAPLPER